MQLDISKKMLFNKTVNMSDYINVGDPAITLDNNPVFIGYGWYCVEAFSEYDDALSNVMIRAKADVGRKLDDFQHKMSTDGWKTKYIPPIIDVDTNLPIDGRKRIKAALRSGEKYIPAAFYKFGGTGANQKIISATINGWISNEHDDADELEFDDILSGYGGLMEGFGLGNTESEVTDMLGRAGAENYFHKRTYNNLVRAIMKLGKGGTQLMHNLDRYAAIRWLKDAGLDIDSLNTDPDAICEYILFTPSSVNTFRAIAHILSNAVTKKSTKFILYTANEFDPVDATKKMNVFETEVTDKIGNIASLVNNELNTANPFLASPFKSSYWEIMGCIPQKTTEMHKRFYEAQKLIPLEDY